MLMSYTPIGMKMTTKLKYAAQSRVNLMLLESRKQRKMHSALTIYK